MKLTHIIRRVDGEEIYGEYAFMACDGPDDWTVAEESEHDEPTDYEILECRRVSIKTFDMPEEDEEDE